MLTKFFIFILGLVFGSFLNAWQYRQEAQKSLRGRSFCPKCKKKIVWYDNIPLLSWIILRGKCRHCQKSISVQYPTIELITAIGFLSIWLLSSPGIALNNWFDEIFNLTVQQASLQFSIFNQFPIIEFVKLILLFSYFTLLMLVGLHDAKTKYVLVKHTYIALGLGAIYTVLGFRGALNAINFLNYIYPYLLSALVPAAIFWSISKLSKGRAMGTGDTDIALTLGIILGWPKIIAGYYLAFIPAAIYGVALLLLKKGHLKSEVPFGPFLITGGFLGLLYGQQIFDWYARIFLGY